MKTYCPIGMITQADIYSFRCVMQVTKPNGEVVIIEPDENGEICLPAGIEGSEITIVYERTLRQQ